MKIGVFDSGLGGLVIAHSLIKLLPEYDYIYLGDIARVPYGNRTQEVITTFTEEGVRYLLNRDCELVIVACNTASSEALRKIQQQLIVQCYPKTKVLGVLIPAAEAAVEATKNNKIGVLATSSTVTTNAFVREITKLLPNAIVYQEPAPLLVPLIEHEGNAWSGPVLQNYLQPLLTHTIDTLILGCTHYSLVKDEVKQVCGPSVTVISQDEVVPKKLKNYLGRHPEITERLNQNKSRDFLVTNITPHVESLARDLFGQSIQLTKVSIN